MSSIEKTHASQAPTVAAKLNAVFADEHPCTILLVEDNLINQKVARLTLKKMGYTIDVAMNGEQGVEAAARREYDLILMDIQMPIMDGYEATRRIRQQSGSSDFPQIVALTANAQKEARDKSFESGMNDFITKPLKPDRIKEVLRSIPKRANGKSKV